MIKNREPQISVKVANKRIKKIKNQRNILIVVIIVVIIIFMLIFIGDFGGLWSIGPETTNYGDDNTTNIYNDDESNPFTKTLQWDTTQQFGYGTEEISNTNVINDSVILDEYEDVGYNENFSISDNFIYNSSEIQFIDGEALLTPTLSENYTWSVTEPSNYTYDVDNIIVDSGGASLGNWNNNSCQFDGTNEYLDAGNDNSLRVTNNFSCFSWINTSTYAETLTICGRYETSGTLRAWYMDIDNGVFRVILSKDGTYIAGQRKYYYTFDSYLGDWHLVGFTFFNDSLILYVDGSEATVIKTYDDEMFQIHDPTTDFFMGARGGSSPTAYFDGNLDELSLWGIALTPSEITELYNNGNALNLVSHSEYDNLISWWRMGDNDTIPIIQDNKGSNNATSINMESSDIYFSGVNSYILDNPSVSSIYGYPYTNKISSFIPSATLPSGSNIKYQVSIDNGTTWKFWSGSSWVDVTLSMSDDWYYNNEAVLSSVVNTYIIELPLTGIFSFKAFLHSDTGSVTPILSSVFIEEGTTYSIGSYEFEMKNSIIPDRCFGWFNFTDIVTTSIYTSIKYKVSYDNTTYNSEWLNETEVEDYIRTIYCYNNASDMIKFKFLLTTTTTYYTPKIDNIKVYSENGYKESGYYTSGWFDWTEYVIFRKLTFNITVSSGCNYSIYVRFSQESIDILNIFRSGTNNTIYNLAGCSFQFKIIFLSNGRNTPILDWLKIQYWVNIIHQI